MYLLESGLLYHVLILKSYSFLSFILSSFPFSVVHSPYSFTICLSASVKLGKISITSPTIP